VKESTAKVRALPVVASIVSGPSVGGFGDAAALRVAGPSYPNAAALLANAAFTADAVMLYPTDAAQAFDWLRSLRRDSRYAISPVFTTRRWNEAVDALSDGAITDPSQIYEQCAAIHDNSRALPTRAALDAEERVLAFLYTRPNYVLQPVCDWSTAQIYSYPLLDAFAPPHTDGMEWSATLRRRGLLEAVSLVDRIRECPSCAGAHLNFVDVCPQCSAIDISESIFLHCHTCGHVAKQDEFIARNTLSCPKCLIALRHVGVDYDRALEAFSCAKCAGRFTEPDVRARCLHCHKSYAADALSARRIEAMKLSEAGRLAARSGRVGDLFALIDEFNCVHPAYFEQTLDFLLNLSRRHKEVEFGLVCLKFANVRELISQLPRVQVVQMVDGFATRLRELVRTTDMVLRSDDEHCWLLLPQTPQAGIEVLVSRVQMIPGKTALSAQHALQLAIASTGTCSLAERNIDAKLLMAELRAKVS
jgi:hypothetical protein